MPNYQIGVPGNIGHPAKKFYVTQTREIFRPDNLSVMASSRGVDVIATGSYASTNYGAQAANWTASSPVIPGFWEVLPPEARWPTTGSAVSGTAIPWATSNTYSDDTNPTNWGYVHPRPFGQAITVMADGHVQMAKLADLRDMRKWANKATTAINYNPQQGP